MSGQDHQRLAAAGAAFGRELSVREREQLLRYLHLLLAWNVRINLTGARTLAEVADEHLPDSFALERLVGPGAALVDVGSGGGLPAVPFAALRPDVRVTFVEPRAKRVAFLRTAVRELGLSADVLPTRAESLPAGAFDVASSRATFPPGEWLEVGRRLVRPGGHVVLFLTSPGETISGGALVAGRVDYRTGSGRGRTALAISVPPGST